MKSLLGVRSAIKRLQALKANLEQQIRELGQESAPSGRAMMGAAKPSDVGGIDLNAAKLDIQEQGNDIKMNLPVIDLKAFENMNFTGFTPIIINIVPITNLPMLLGATPEEEPQEISLAE